jgi:toxin HigB-1
MIVSFRDADTAALASGRRVTRFVSIEAVARRKLRQLEIAGRLEDLRVPPGTDSKPSSVNGGVNTAFA